MTIPNAGYSQVLLYKSSLLRSLLGKNRLNNQLYWGSHFDSPFPQIVHCYIVLSKYSSIPAFTISILLIFKSPQAVLVHLGCIADAHPFIGFDLALEAIILDPEFCFTANAGFVQLPID